MKWRIGLILATLLLAMPGRASADTGTSDAADAALDVMAQINQARLEHGLVPFRSDARLWGLAEGRATRLATTGILSHEVAGSMPDDLSSWGIRWFGYGEDIGYASGQPSEVASFIFRMWVESPTHWTLLMSPDYNYLGVGLVYRPESGVTFASVVMTESPDRSGARAAVAGGLVSGDDIRWSWRGWDLPLQTHTSGLRDFTIQFRTDRGTWVTLASGTGATARATLNRVRGHWYSIRVRARDRAGNVGPWSREFRVWLP